jgi:hypothetical protein
VQTQEYRLTSDADIFIQYRITQLFRYKMRTQYPMRRESKSTLQPSIDRGKLYTALLIQHGVYTIQLLLLTLTFQSQSQESTFRKSNRTLRDTIVSRCKLYGRWTSGASTSTTLDLMPSIVQKPESNTYHIQTLRSVFSIDSMAVE